MSYRGLVMYEDHLTAWVKALRSGKYLQKEGFLQHEDGFCCLGVFAKIQKVKSKKVEDERYKEFNFNGDKRSDSLPSEWFEGFFVWTGPTKKSATKEAAVKALTDKFVSMNDDDGLPFDGIADWIEKKLR